MYQWRRWRVDGVVSFNRVSSHSANPLKPESVPARVGNVGSVSHVVSSSRLINNAELGAAVRFEIKDGKRERTKNKGRITPHLQITVNKFYTFTRVNIRVKCGVNAALPIESSSTAHCIIKPKRSTYYSECLRSK